MVEYTNTEYTDRVLVYGEAAFNGRATHWIYQERYPSHNLLAEVIQRVRERGTVTVNRADYDAPRRRRVAPPNLKKTY